MSEETNKDEALKADESQIEVESPATENLPTQEEGEKVETESTEEVNTEVSPKPEGRKTADSRIRELVAEKKNAESKAESLAEQVKRLTSFRPQTDYIPEANTSNESEITVEEVLRKADALTQLRLAQQDNIHRVQQEASEAMKAYPELDPDSDNYDAELSDSITQATLAKIQADPTYSVKKFVDAMIKPYKTAVERQATGQRETITKQVSEQAMRPTQVQGQEKPFSELSIEEMEKRLGVNYR